VAGNAPARCRTQSRELEFFTPHTNPNAATTACTSGTGSQSTGEDRRGKLPRCQMCSIGGRSYGAPLGVQQKLMRHANISTTMNVYGGAFMEAKRKANTSVVQRVLLQDRGK
jgi:hypothetical protein